MKIAFFESENWEKDYLAEHLSDFELVFLKEHLESETVHLAKDCQIVSTFTDSQVTKEVIDNLPNVKLITNRATGFDNIDIAEAKNHGVIVCNVPTYGENTVAEHAFGLILNLSRRIYESIQNVKELGFAHEGVRGFDLMGKTIGIVGLGHIGQHVARIAHGFQMNIIAFDVSQDKKLAKQLGLEYVSLEELLKKSDIISLHVPYNAQTHHLINVDNIGLIKKGAYLINTARGGIVQTDALVKALEDGILAGAGLDVLEGEHDIKEERQLLFDNSRESDFKMLLENHILMEKNNVIITPHNAFNSKEALERILETTIDNIKAFVAKKPINVVNK